MNNHRLLQFIIDRLNQSVVPPAKLCFEITETAAVENLTAASRFIKMMRALGCSFALDDFGSGMSSFAYLQNLDVDFVKIDGQFVRDITRNKVSYECVAAINRIARTMGKQSIAEFVEDEDILNGLREMRVDYGQGYYFARPRRLEEFEMAAGIPVQSHESGTAI